MYGYGKLMGFHLEELFKKGNKGVSFLGELNQLRRELGNSGDKNEKSLLNELSKL